MSGFAFDPLGGGTLSTNSGFVVGHSTLRGTWSVPQ